MFVLWCNGSTTVFGSVCLSSNLGRTTKRGGCVKMLAQLFFMRKAQTFPSPGFVMDQCKNLRDFHFMHIT